MCRPGCNDCVLDRHGGLEVPGKGQVALDQVRIVLLAQAVVVKVVVLDVPRLRQHPVEPLRDCTDVSIWVMGLGAIGSDAPA